MIAMCGMQLVVSSLWQQEACLLMDICDCVVEKKKKEGGGGGGVRGVLTCPVWGLTRYSPEREEGWGGRQ